MIAMTINGLKVQVEKGTSVLEAARWVGFPVPTLCAEDGLRPYGACRLCMVEIGDAPRTKLVAACTYMAEEGLKVRTNSDKVQQARKLLLELYVSVCPQSKRIQDLASEYGVRQCRYDDLKHEDCIQCGLCVRMCEQQMMACAIGFSGRGLHRDSRHRQRERVEDGEPVAGRKLAVLDRPLDIAPWTVDLLAPERHLA